MICLIDGTTQCKWDTTIPLNDYIIIDGKPKTQAEYLLDCFKKGQDYKEAVKYFKEYHKEGLWSQYQRIVKENGAILLFAQTPFDKELGMSNPNMLRYEWIWEKTSATGHLNAKKMPMKAHENILVFYKKLPVYNPQKTQGHPPVHFAVSRIETQNRSSVYNKATKETISGGATDRYPRSVQVFSSDKQTCCLHPTQKPVKLCEYFIKTYTNEGAVVLDNCCGSATTGVAAINTNRNFIGIELDADIFHIAHNRLKKYTQKIIL